MEAELADGTILEFPDGTAPNVIQATVKRMLAGGVSNAPKEAPAQVPLTTAERVALEADKILTGLGSALPDVLPSRKTLLDVASSAAGTMRGGANLLSEGLGEKMFPRQGENLAGELLDPAAIAIGGGAGKIAQAVPRIGTYGRAALSGLLGGGAVGGLSDTGSATEGSLVGALFGLTLPAAGKLAGKAIDTLKGAGADIQAGRMLSAVGADLGALQAAPRGVNVAQAMGDKATAELAAMQEIAAKHQPNAALAIRQAQENARRAAMAEVSGGMSATQSRQSQGVARDTITREFQPGMTTELNAANEANRQLAVLEPQLAQKRMSEISALQGQGITSTESAQRAATAAEGKPGFLTQGDRAAEFADTAAMFGEVKQQRQAEREFIESKIGSLESHGLKPLTIDPIIAKIDSLMSNVPGMTNDLLSGIKTTIAETAKNNQGRLDAYDLYEIRKNEINSTITRLLKDSGNAEKARASDLAGKVKKAIDNAIIDAGGTEWKTHLDKYSLGMRSIERQKMGQTAMGMSNKKLISLVGGNAPKEVEKVFGPGKYDFTRAMGSEASPFQRAAQELQRDITLSEKAAAGGDKASQIVLDNLFTFHLPNLLRQDISLVNRAMEAAGSRINKKTIERMSQAMYDPVEAARIIQTAPLHERNLILKLMSDPTGTGVATGMMTGATQ